MRFYLAGGMKSGWQRILKEAEPRFEYIDPTTHGLSDPKEYTKWDLKGVEDCDWVIAYMEADNPSGIGMSLEVGYAYALSKNILFIDGVPDNHYFDMVRVCSYPVVYSLEEAIKYLGEIK